MPSQNRPYVHTNISLTPVVIHHARSDLSIVDERDGAEVPPREMSPPRPHRNEVRDRLLRLADNRFHPSGPPFS